MDLRDIKDLIQTVSKTDIAEFEFEQDGYRIRISKQMAEGARQARTISAQSVPQVEPSNFEEVNVAKNDNVIEITAPMVGTFYRAPSPDSAPFVKEGDLIEPGRSLCIIEAMKLMNEIESEQKGRLVKVLVENGQPVEYGQPLFLLEPIK